MAQPKKFVAQDRGYKFNYNWHTPLKRVAPFNNGVDGVTAVVTPDGWDSGGGKSKYGTDPVEGLKCCKTTITDGDPGVASVQVGGYLISQSGFKKGDVVYQGCKVLFPAGFDLAAVNDPPPSSRQKFLRLRNLRANGSAIGHIDWYIVRDPDAAGFGAQFQFIKEGETPIPFWRNVGTRENDIVLGQWQSYQTRVVIDDVPEDSGGSGRIDFFIGGELVESVTDVKTIENPDDVLTDALYFTYWDDRGASATQSWFIDDAFIRNGDPDGADSQGNARFNQ